VATKARASASLRKLTTCWSSLTCHGQSGLRLDALTTIFTAAYLRSGESESSLALESPGAMTWMGVLTGGLGTIRYGLSDVSEGHARVDVEASL
jgi:hypothetical protein